MRAESSLSVFVSVKNYMRKRTKITFQYKEQRAHFYLFANFLRVSAYLYTGNWNVLLTKNNKM